jgi:predicted DNA-binding transcriptional regulator AlpA
LATLITAKLARSRVFRRVRSEIDSVLVRHISTRHSLDHADSAQAGAALYVLFAASCTPSRLVSQRCDMPRAMRSPNLGVAGSSPAPRKRNKRPRYRPSLALQADPHFQTLELLVLVDGTFELVARLATVCDLVEASPAKIYRLMKGGSKKIPIRFPRPVRLGGRDKGCVAWIWSEIQAWLARCACIAPPAWLVSRGSNARIGSNSARRTTAANRESGSRHHPQVGYEGLKPFEVVSARSKAVIADRDFERGIAKEESHSRAFASGVLPGRRREIVITTDLDEHAYIAEIDELAREIMRSQAAPVGWEDKAFGVRRYFLTELGAKLQRASAGFSDHFMLKHARHHFHPHVTLILRAFERWGERIRTCSYSLPVGIAAIARLAFKSTVRLIRHAGQSRGLRWAMSNDRRRELKEFQSGCAYAASLIRLLPIFRVIRIHLYFLNANQLARSIATDVWLDPMAANASFAKFGRALRRHAAFSDVCGWLAVRSEGLVQGIHFDVMLWLDGRAAIDAAEYAAQLGRYWTERCTGPDHVGRALIPNPKSARQFNGIEPLSCANVRGLLSIRAAIRAMCSRDYELRAGTGGDHNFRRGLIRVPPPSRMDPGTHSHDLSAVMQILGGAKSGVYRSR